MRSSAAEVARTLAVGRLPGRLTIGTAGLEISHATVADGTVLIAARRGTPEWARLTNGVQTGEALLAIDDVPPFPDSPAYPSVHIRGTLERVAPTEERGAALAFAEANPVGDLLDVGQADSGRPDGGEPDRAGAVDLFRLIPQRVWLRKCHAAAEVTLDEFAAATPDPLQAEEHDLLADLREHHAAQLAALVPGQADAHPVRVDRYGVLLALPRLARVEFAHPATDADCVARALGLH